MHAIFGYGVVGKALGEVLREAVEVRIYDPKHPNLGAIEDAVRAETWWVCVPTDGLFNGRLSHAHVADVIRLASEQAQRPMVIVKSTLGLGARFPYDRWAFSPEFLVESAPTMRNPNRVVVGAGSTHLLQEAAQLCAAIPAWKHAPLVACTTNEAILIKLASNAMLALKVEAANELYDLCADLQIDYETVRLGISLDRRIGGAHMLVPGPDGLRGFGGKCLPKDTAELASQGLEVFRTVSECNRLRRSASPIQRKANLG